MAPVLLKEFARQGNREGMFQAVYETRAVLPGMVAKCRYNERMNSSDHHSARSPRYWHRPLNVKKLLAVGFLHVGRNMTVPRMQKLYRLPEVKPFLEDEMKTGTRIPPSIRRHKWKVSAKCDTLIFRKRLLSSARYDRGDAMIEQHTLNFAVRLVSEKVRFSPHFYSRGIRISLPESSEHR